MEFKSIEFTGDHSIKTTYMAGEVRTVNSNAS